MYYLYFIDNLGRAYLEAATPTKEKMQEEIIKEINVLDPDTRRKLIITTEKRLTKEVKEW